MKKKTIKQLRAVLKRRYRSMPEAASTSTDWSQSLIHFSLQKRTRNFVPKQALTVYKQSLYTKSLWEALKMWERQDKNDTDPSTVPTQ